MNNYWVKGVASFKNSQANKVSFCVSRPSSDAAIAAVKEFLNSRGDLASFEYSIEMIGLSLPEISKA